MNDIRFSGWLTGKVARQMPSGAVAVSSENVLIVS